MAKEMNFRESNSWYIENYLLEQWLKVDKKNYKCKYSVNVKIEEEIFKSTSSDR